MVLNSLANTKLQEEQIFVQKLNSKLDFIEKELIIAKKLRMDPWISSKRSQTEQQDFKQRLIKYYQRADPPNNIFCMVLNKSYPSKQVIAFHIWKSATNGKGMDEFGLKAKDLHSERNGLLLASAIEQAFDVKRVCFQYNPLNKQLILVVLDPSLLPTLVTPSTTSTFQSISGRCLQHPNGNYPFRRILGWHAKMSYEHAFEQGWIDQATFEQFQDHQKLSNPSLPDDDWNDEE